MVQGACHLKECGIVHCDLKPENLLFTTPECNEIKIIDLGTACVNPKNYYSYVCTRMYRSPEVELGYE